MSRINTIWDTPISVPNPELEANKPIDNLISTTQEAISNKLSDPKISEEMSKLKEEKDAFAKWIVENASLWNKEVLSTVSWWPKEIKDFFSSEELKKSLERYAKKFKVDLDEQFKLLSDLIISRSDYNEIFPILKDKFESKDRKFVFSFMRWNINNEYLETLKPKIEDQKNQLENNFNQFKPNKNNQRIEKEVLLQEAVSEPEVNMDQLNSKKDTEQIDGLGGVEKKDNYDLFEDFLEKWTSKGIEKQIEEWEHDKEKIINQVFEWATLDEKKSLLEMQNKSKNFAVTSMMKTQEISKAEAIKLYDEDDNLKREYAVQFTLYNENAQTEFFNGMSEDRQAVYKGYFTQIDGLNKSILGDKYNLLSESAKVVNYVEGQKDLVRDKTKDYPSLAIVWRNLTRIDITFEDDEEVMKVTTQSRPVKNAIVDLEAKKNFFLKDLKYNTWELEKVDDKLIKDDQLKEKVNNWETLTKEEEKDLLDIKERSNLEEIQRNLELRIEEINEKIKDIDEQIKIKMEELDDVEWEYVDSVKEKADIARENIRILDYLGFTNLNDDKLNEVLAQVSGWILNTHIEPWNGWTIDFSKKDFGIWSVVDETYALKSMIRLYNKMLTQDQNNPNDVEGTYRKLTQKAHKQDSFEGVNRTNILELKENGILSNDWQLKTNHVKMLENLSFDPKNIDKNKENNTK